MPNYSQRSKNGDYTRFHSDGRITHSMRTKNGTYFTTQIARSYKEVAESGTPWNLNGPNFNPDSASALKYGLLSIVLFWTAIVPALGIISGLRAFFSHDKDADTAGSLPAAIFGFVLSAAFMVPAVIILTHVIHFFSGQG